MTWYTKEEVEASQAQYRELRKTSGMPIRPPIFYMPGPPGLSYEEGVKYADGTKPSGDHKKVYRLAEPCY